MKNNNSVQIRLCSGKFFFLVVLPVLNCTAMWVLVYNRALYENGVSIINLTLMIIHFIISLIYFSKKWMFSDVALFAMTILLSACLFDDYVYGGYWGKYLGCAGRYDIEWGWICWLGSIVTLGLITVFRNEKRILEVLNEKGNV